ncbi:uncharacterized protein LOC117669384 [Pantherophis guttatus]|uniref:Uncharacterized protein LOC117669384 n=1 Tax=Pantherophis guttatus TaxID=94885 RepID=A0A6P9C624_PANGU|nr:uncharacterized protein LOC117669384 [Pantherophis guttatus]
MEPWRYFWKLILYILLVSEHTGSQVTFTSPEVPGGTQDLTDSSPLESESNTSLEPEARLPSGWISPMATTELVSEVSTSAAIMADTYEMLSGQLHSLPLESSTPNAESPSQDTTFFQDTSTPAGESRSTDNLSFAEASIAPPGATSIAPSPLPTQGYARSIHSRSIPTRKHSSGFRPPGTSMIKKGSTSAYFLGPQDPTGQMSHPATMKMVSEVSTSAAIMADTYEMLLGQLHSLPLESSTPNGKNPSPETTFFQAINAPDDISRTTDSLSFAEASSAQPWSASTALSPPPTQGYAHSIPARKLSAGFRPPGTSTVKEEPTSSPQGSIGQMSNMATTELVSTSATMLAEVYEMLSSHLHSLPLESSTPNAESPSQETTFFQATSE